jgi:DNA end-binding protein Ku
MEILEFVKADEVDPLYFDASYYATPEDAGKKAYHLLLEAMEESGHAAIAKLYMHQREYIVVIRPRAHGLTLHTMFYADEIRSVSEYGEKDGAEPKEQEKKLALQLIESLSAPFDPKKFHDEYRQSLRAMIEAKLKGQEISAAPHPQLAPVVDLMEALKKSLAGKPAPAKQAPVEMKPMKAMPEAVPARKRAGKRSAG